jgi:hypothetical protein
MATMVGGGDRESVVKLADVDVGASGGVERWADPLPLVALGSLLVDDGKDNGPLGSTCCAEAGLTVFDGVVTLAASGTCVAVPASWAPEPVGVVDETVGGAAGGTDDGPLGAAGVDASTGLLSPLGADAAPTIWVPVALAGMTRTHPG